MNTGFFYIDKPQGITSHDVVSRMRKILSMKKVGHSGTLDPMATGVLIVACGPSTRLLDYVQASVKEYVADVRFGMKTSSGDADGQTVEIIDMSSLKEKELRDALAQFVGTIMQIPPMVSAIKVDGKKLYEYEREGIEVERAARETIIDSIEIEEFTPGKNGSTPYARLRIRCHAGTYIRTLAEDIAAALEGCAYLTSLRRTYNGNVNVEECVTLDELERMDHPFDKIVSPLGGLNHYPNYELDENQGLAVSHGQSLVFDRHTNDVVSQLQAPFFVVTAQYPRNLIAIYPSGEISDRRSRCVVFLDGEAS